MGFMEELVADLQICEENQPMKKVIEERAIQLWNERGYGQGMSQNTASQIATLVRHPDRKKGKAKKG